MNGDIKMKITELVAGIIEKNVSSETLEWFRNAATSSSSNHNNYQFNISFTSVPRKTGKKEIVLQEADARKLNGLLNGFSIQNWTIDRLCRAWLLMQLESSDKESYVSRINNLFPAAEMNEQVALYSALPLLEYPKIWKARCAEGIRSNIDTVLAAIMYYNPYPAAYLDEPAWNQLIMKAFFTGKNVNNIVGLDKRANPDLANILFDYIEERWSAHRTVNPQIWRLTGRFMDQAHFYMIEKLFSQGNETDRKAAALACADSSLEKSKLLLAQYPEYQNVISKEELTWEMIVNNQ